MSEAAGTFRSIFALFGKCFNTHMEKHVNLDHPEEVLSYVAQKHAKESYKANLIDYYSHYCDFNGLKFSKPKYHRDHKLPYVPSKEELCLFISHANPKYSMIYSIMKDTGLRPVEVSAIEHDDIDLEKGIISVRTAKHGQPRIVKLKSQTLGMLKVYVQKHQGNLFPRSGVISNTFGRLRASLIKKLQNPNLHKIRFYDFRHYYATNLYHDTRDLLLVKEKLGHKNIQNTLVYTHLVNIDEETVYYCATAKSIEGALKKFYRGSSANQLNAL